MAVIEVTKWRNVTWHWQNVSDGENLLSRKRRTQRCVSVWVEGVGSHVVTYWSGVCVSAQMCVWTSTSPLSTQRRACHVVDWSLWVSAVYVCLSATRIKPTRLHASTHTHFWLFIPAQTHLYTVHTRLHHASCMGYIGIKCLTESQIYVFVSTFHWSYLMLRLNKLFKPIVPPCFSYGVTKT